VARIGGCVFPTPVPLCGDFPPMSSYFGVFAQTLNTLMQFPLCHKLVDVHVQEVFVSQDRPQTSLQFIVKP